MTKQEKRALLDVLSKIESQKKFIEDSMVENGLSFFLTEDPVGLNSSDYFLGSLNAYRACLAVLKSYFC